MQLVVMIAAPMASVVPMPQLWVESSPGVWSQPQLVLVVETEESVEVLDDAEVVGEPGSFHMG